MGWARAGRNSSDWIGLDRVGIKLEWIRWDGMKRDGVEVGWGAMRWGENGLDWLGWDGIGWERTGWDGLACVSSHGKCSLSAAPPQQTETTSSVWDHNLGTSVSTEHHPT